MYISNLLEVSYNKLGEKNIFFIINSSSIDSYSNIKF